jgi:hypothetical protein
LRPHFICSLSFAIAAVGAACSGANGLGGARSANADKFYQQAVTAYAAADMDEARDSVNRALADSPTDPETKTLAAKIALTRLDFAEAIRLLKDVKCTEEKDDACEKLSIEAASLRGRALWYKGDLEAAADELEGMLNHPGVKDEWAKSVSKLARQGAGRTPFAVSGGMLAVTEVVHVNPDVPYFVVQVEIDGEAALAMIHSANAEVVLDSTTRPDPSWVSLRFGERLEVRDVPAVSQDLSGISKELGAPVKALLGVNLLRRLNATIDYRGRQFVARTFSPPPPPDATRVPLYYFKGGGMVVRGGFGGEKGPRGALLVNTGVAYPIALDQGGWKKAGVDVGTLKPIPNARDLKEGIVPLLRFGAFDIPQVPGLFGNETSLAIESIEQTLQPVDIDGMVGAGFLSLFRCTFADGGRLLWVEDGRALEKILNRGQPAPPPAARPPGASPTNERELPPSPGPRAEPQAKPPAPPPKKAP